MNIDLPFGRRAAAIACGLSLLIFISSATLVLIPTEVVYETRAQSLIRTLSAGQNPDGSFPPFERTDEGFAASTAEAILIFHELGSIHHFNLLKAIDFIVSRQNQTTGGFSEGLHPLELYSPAALVVPALEAVESLDQLNRSLLIEFVLDHYNSSDGGFFEADGMCYFFLILHTLEPLYNHSNIVSTYLGISLLTELGALETINTTRTLEFVTNCRAENGGFRPFPNATIDGNPSFFPTHSVGSGLPYTFCAVKTLETLGHLNESGILDKTSTSQFVWRCQSNDGIFWLTPTNDPWHYWPYDDATVMYTWYAFEALHVLDSSFSSNYRVQRTIEWILSLQWLQYWTSLLPNPLYQQGGFESPYFLARDDLYGLFRSMDRAPITNTFMAIRILALCGGLSYMFTPTHRNFLAWHFLTWIAIYTMISIIGLIIFTIKKTPRFYVILTAIIYIYCLLYLGFYISQFL